MNSATVRVGVDQARGEGGVIIMMILTTIIIAMTLMMSDVYENLPRMVSSFRKMSSGQMLTAWGYNAL